MIDLPGASENLRELAARGVQRSYAKGRLLIEEGDVGDTLFIVVGGRLRVYSVDPANEREITYGSYGPGEYVGEMSLDGGPRSASVEALVRSTCVIVTRRTLDDFIAERPAFAYELLSKVIARARAATMSARRMALNDVYGRLRLWLLSGATPLPDGRQRVQARVTHQEIAHHMGCSRSMVSRMMKGLERAGVIDAAQCPLTILKPPPARW
jgi:CRP/FNR family transcriptional regulator, cyclic AMP receptor protein